MDESIVDPREFFLSRFLHLRLLSFPILCKCECVIFILLNLFIKFVITFINRSLNVSVIFVVCSNNIHKIKSISFTSFAM